MFKEVIIVIIVITLVVGLDVITNNYTKNSVEKLTSNLNILKEEILKENAKNAKKEMEAVKKVWKEKYNLLAYYIEHDELEKVETELTRLNADLEMEEYKQCINELDTTLFILNHIKQKEKFDLKSIF